MRTFILMVCIVIFAIAMVALSWYFSKPLPHAIVPETENIQPTTITGGTGLTPMINPNVYENAHGKG